MKREWTFGKDIQPGLKKSNPQTGREFERLGPVHATAGDPFQNSIDAHDGGDHPVVVELGIHDGDNSLSRDDVSPYFGDELRRHIKAKENGAAEISQGERLATFDEDCEYLTIEDFHTVGLEGRIDQYDPDPPQGTIYANVVNFINRFLWFFRVQNATSDEHDRLGSWGQGKFTLEFASRLGAQIGWSVRKTFENVRQVMMGQTTLRWHNMYSPSNGFGSADPDGTPRPDRFGPFGAFSTSTLEETGQNYSPAPITDDEEIQVFRNTFRMLRKDEPGLSILIPYPQKSLLDSGALARAVIARWAFKIQEGGLVVRIRHNGTLIHELKASTLRNEIENLNWDVEEATIGSKGEANPANRSIDQWISALKLVNWSKYMPSDGHFTTNEAGGGHAPTWANCLGDEDLTALRERFDSGENVKITVLPYVTRFDRGSTLGEFTILMKKATVADSTQFYVREGMMVPFMKNTDGVIAVISCDSTDLSALLRDSEGPAHLSWTPGAKRVLFKANRWNHGHSTVKYVANCIREILAAMKSSEAIESHPFAEFIMTIPAVNAGSKATETPATTTTTVPPPPPPPPESRPAIARVSSKGTRGKVKIRRRKVEGEILPTAGRTIEVDVAYFNARTPNHWRAYSEHDFVASDIEATKTKGVTLLSSIAKPCGSGPGGACNCTNSQGKKRQCAASKKRGLVFTFEIEEDDWAIDLAGFGTSRDVAVNVTPVEVSA